MTKVALVQLEDVHVAKHLHSPKAQPSALTLVAVNPTLENHPFGAASYVGREVDVFPALGLTARRVFQCFSCVG